MTSLDAGAAAAARANIARGGALVALGAGLTALGAAGISFFNGAADAAATYDTAARRAFTQVDNGTTSLADLKKIGLDVAKSIPIAFDDTQKALYNIFSTVDVNTPQAEKLLKSFAKAAVGDQTDLDTATTGTLRIMNAFQIKIEDVGKANDVMFQLVRKGVGTYGDFVTAIGKAAPSAVRAGQGVESLAGMMAFLTRNGLSASMAATSASRALDAVSNPKVAGNMKKLGVNILDASGNFKPMDQIMSQVTDKLANMTAPEKAKALTDLFKGAGNNVQAMRFFNLVVNNDKAYNDLTTDMRNSSGTMDKAYDIMFKAPQSQVQFLNNRYKAMKVEIGNGLLPIKVKLFEILSKVLGLWNDLPGPVQHAIVIIGAVISVLLVLAGILTMVAGVMMILNGALVLAGTTLGAILLPVALVIAAVIAIGVAIWALIKYHQQVWDFIKKMWSAVLGFITGVWNSIWGVIKGPVEWIWNLIQSVFGRVREFLGGLWDSIVAGISAGWNDLSGTFGKGVDKVRGWIDQFVKWFQRIGTELAPVFKFAGVIMD